MQLLVDILLMLIVLMNFAVLGSTRVRMVISITAAQGAIVGCMPLVHEHVVEPRTVLMCLLAVAIKALVVPSLLNKAVRDVHIRREVEPLLGLVPCMLLGGIGTALAIHLAGTLPVADHGSQDFVLATSFSTVLTGFIILTTRRKAITQVVGYLILENGIFLFGLLLIEAIPFLVEMGVLLDVFVGVFVMGIILNHIQRTFSTLDTTQLTGLRE